MVSSDRPAARKTFDWAAARARLELLQRTLAETQNGSPDQIRRLLKARAATLAAKIEQLQLAETMDLVGFRLGQQACAVEIGQVAEAIELPAVRFLPGAPQFYLGLIIHRGVVVPLVNVRVLLDLPGSDGESPAFAILVRARNCTVALAVTAIDGVKQVSASELAGAPDGGSLHSAILGIVSPDTTVIDAHRLALDARLIVNEEPQAANYY